MGRGGKGKGRGGEEDGRIVKHYTVRVCQSPISGTASCLLKMLSTTSYWDCLNKTGQNMLTSMPHTCTIARTHTFSLSSPRLLLLQAASLAESSKQPSQTHDKHSTAMTPEAGEGRA